MSSDRTGGELIGDSKWPLPLLVKLTSKLQFRTEVSNWARVNSLQRSLWQRLDKSDNLGDCLYQESGLQGRIARVVTVIQNYLLVQKMLQAINAT